MAEGTAPTGLSSLRVPVRLSRYSRHAPAGFGLNAGQTPRGQGGRSPRWPQHKDGNPSPPPDPVQGDAFSPFGEAVRSLAFALMPAPMSLAVQIAEAYGYNQDLFGETATLADAMNDVAAQMNPFSDHQTARSTMKSISKSAIGPGMNTQGPSDPSRSEPPNVDASSKGMTNQGTGPGPGPAPSEPSEPGGFRGL